MIYLLFPLKYFAGVEQEAAINQLDRWMEEYVILKYTEGCLIIYCHFWDITMIILIVVKSSRLFFLMCNLPILLRVTDGRILACYSFLYIPGWMYQNSKSCRWALGLIGWRKSRKNKLYRVVYTHKNKWKISPRTTTFGRIITIKYPITRPWVCNFWYWQNFRNTTMTLILGRSFTGTYEKKIPL